MHMHAQFIKLAVHISCTCDAATAMRALCIFALAKHVGDRRLIPGSLVKYVVHI